jgi:hypothetical protein
VLHHVPVVKRMNDELSNLRRKLQHQAQRCRDREFLRLPSSILHETRRVPVGDPRGRKQMKSLGRPGKVSPYLV